MKPFSRNSSVSPRTTNYHTDVEELIRGMAWNYSDITSQNYRGVLKPEIAERWAAALDNYSEVLSVGLLKESSPFIGRFKEHPLGIKEANEAHKATAVTCHCMTGLLCDLAVQDGLAKWVVDNDEANEITGCTAYAIVMADELTESESAKKYQSFNHSITSPHEEMTEWAIHEDVVEAANSVPYRCPIYRLAVASKINDVLMMSTNYETYPELLARSKLVCTETAKLIRQELVYTGK